MTPPTGPTQPAAGRRPPADEPAPGACPHCEQPIGCFAGMNCPWCARRLDGPHALSDADARRRVAIMAAAVALLGAWFLAVPWSSWNTLNATVFAAISAFLLFTTWIVSGVLLGA